MKIAVYAICKNEEKFASRWAQTAAEADEVVVPVSYTHLLFSAASFEAPLIPKLRGHFAEFLNKGSPVRLRILSSPTCVGLRYGRLYIRQQLFSPV